MNAKNITSKTINIYGRTITCHSDGSVTQYRKTTGTPKRTFGYRCKEYRQVAFGRKSVYVHRIIATAFHGKPPPGSGVDHINGHKSDNRPENLRWVNQSQNLRGARKPHGESKYRGVSRNGPSWGTQVLSKRYGSFKTEVEAAKRFDDVAHYKYGFPLEGLNFPQRIIDKQGKNDNDSIMQNTPENIERIQTQIEMIRQESRILSYRIERMMEQRKALSEEKRKLKDALATYGVK